MFWICASPSISAGGISTDWSDPCSFGGSSKTTKICAKGNNKCCCKLQSCTCQAGLPQLGLRHMWHWSDCKTQSYSCACDCLTWPAHAHYESVRLSAFFDPSQDRWSADLLMPVLYWTQNWSTCYIACLKRLWMPVLRFKAKDDLGLGVRQIVWPGIKVISLLDLVGFRASDSQVPLLYMHNVLCLSYFEALWIGLALSLSSLGLSCRAKEAAVVLNKLCQGLHYDEHWSDNAILSRMFHVSDSVLL